MKDSHNLSYAPSKIFRVASLTLMSAMLLTACGGGGSSNSNVPQTPDDGGTNAGTPQPTAFKVTTQNTAISLAENTSTDLSVSFTGANGDVSATVEESLPSALSVSISDISANGAMINIAVPELENDGSDEIVVTFTDSAGQTDSYTIGTSLVNSSGEKALANYEIAAWGAGTFINLEPERELFKRFKKILKMKGVPTADIPVFPVNLNLTTRADLINFSNARSEVVNSYLDSTITETEVRAKTDDILALSGDFVIPVNSVLEELVSLASGTVPELPLGVVSLDKESGLLLSQFIGNAQMGAYSTEWVWTFNNEYQFMAQLTQSSASCQAAE